jgi:hypothetical protein
MDIGSWVDVGVVAVRDIYDSQSVARPYTLGDRKNVTFRIAIRKNVKA